jgi:hypothetical protein
MVHDMTIYLEDGPNRIPADSTENRFSAQDRQGTGNEEHSYDTNITPMLKGIRKCRAARFRKSAFAPSASVSCLD